MKTMNLLIIGRHEDRYINRNARLLHDHAQNAGIDVEWITYEELFSEPPKMFAGNALLVSLFFPHRFWDDNCELPEDTGLYGTSVRSFELFQQYMFRVWHELSAKYPLYTVSYLIDPQRAAIDRDKIGTIQILSEAGVPVTRSIASRDVHDLLAHVSHGSALFIKCRYGSEGKGITYVSKEKWLTNYRVEDGRLGNYGIHERWTLSDITGRVDLLRELLKTEVIIEQEIVTPEIEPGMKFDVRAYVLDDQVPHMFLRTNQNERIITNYSQGAKVRHNYNDLLGREQIDLIKITARTAAKAMDARFIGVDCMFDRDWNIVVVETQVFTDFPDITHFDLAKHLVDKIGATD